MPAHRAGSEKLLVHCNHLLFFYTHSFTICHVSDRLQSPPAPSDMSTATHVVFLLDLNQRAESDKEWLIPQTAGIGLHMFNERSKNDHTINFLSTKSGFITKGSWRLSKEALLYDSLFRIKFLMYNAWVVFIFIQCCVDRSHLKRKLDLDAEFDHL
ncbi:hypothetical protein BHE74_00022890 [Ensete ventricosum]|nr:hypothetical protein BHE74_00022890 [Ensete ventricosum]